VAGVPPEGVRVGGLAVAAQRAADLLRAQKGTIAVLDATTGGLIQAMLQAVPRSSRFFLGGMTIYSRQAALQLPRELREKLGTPQENYASPPAYWVSKQVFTDELSSYISSQFSSTWSVAESGAVDPAGLPEQLRGAGAFTSVTVRGPGVHVSRLYRVEGCTREEAMVRFAIAALALLAEALESKPLGKL